MLYVILEPSDLLLALAANIELVAPLRWLEDLHPHPWTLGDSLDFDSLDTFGFEVDFHVRVGHLYNYPCWNVGNITQTNHCYLHTENC